MTRFEKTPSVDSIDKTFASPAKVSIVVPTFNEAGNLVPLTRSIHDVLGHMDHEIIFVDDDSPDGTSEKAKSVAASDPRVRCIRRVGRRGLSSAAVEGFLSSSAPYLALIDGDLQHDESVLPHMIERLEEGADLVIGSRFTDGDKSNGFANTRRRRLSLWGRVWASRLLKVQTTDPMSGFFAMRREFFDAVAPKLSLRGFKILVDILTSAGPRPRVNEVPYAFRDRHSGESKLDNVALLEFLLLTVDKTVGRYLPPRFLLFSAVGAFGVFVHLAILAGGLDWFRLPFMAAQAVAALAAMTGNFALNNMFTFRDRQLKGRRFLFGLLSFYAICSVGFVANVGVGNFIFGQGNIWWVAGLLGALVGAVWNYAVSSALTWRKG